MTSRWPTCASCGGAVHPRRHCYAIPTCFTCLPEPEPLPIARPRSTATNNPPPRAAED